jgi:DNA-binding transcriptional ArsR family regulator
MDMYSALAEPTRRTILEILATSGRLSATDIYDRFDVSHPAISQHLKILRDSNLVTVEKKAQQRLYRINPDSLSQIEDWLHKLQKEWNPQFDRLDTLFENEKKTLKKQRG